MRHEALAGDEIEPAVAVQIDQRRGVALRPGGVDRAARPRAVGALLEPEHAVVVAGGRDDVVAAVAVHVEHVHEAELGDASAEAAAGLRLGRPEAAC